MSKKLINQIISNLDDNKALDINSLSLKGKSDIADYLIIATGTSSRHVSSLAEKTVDDLKKNNIKNVNTEGLDKGDWVLIDGGDIIIHLFREEVREFYDIENAHDVDPIKLLKTDSLLLIGNFQKRFLDHYVLTYDSTYYHNPYMNRMWSEINVSSIKKK